MPPSKKFTKENIIDSAFNIVKEAGMENLNARNIAKKLNSSVQPIFHNFNSMNELKDELCKKIYLTYMNYMSKNLNDEKPYKQLGKNYIKFAKTEPKLFQILFMTETNMTPQNFVNSDGSYQKFKNYIEISTNLKDDNVKNFHIKMWIFTHGVASLVANNTCNFTDEDIDKLLSDEYNALMSLNKK